MVGGDHQKILLPHLLQEFAQPCVEFGQCLCVAVNIPAVAEVHVKIHQIHKAQSFKIRLRVMHGVIHAVCVGLVVHVLRGAASCKNIIDFANGNGSLARLHNGIHHGALRLQRIVVPVGGALEAGPAVTHKGTGDDTAHTVLALQNGPSLAAALVEFLQRNQLLMGCHLKNGVHGGVDDPLARVQLLLPVVTDHVGSGVGPVAQAATAGGRLKGIQHLLRKSFRIGGHGFRRHNTGNLPVTDGGVLAHGFFRQPGIGAQGLFRLGQAGDAVNLSKTCRNHVGNVQLGRGGAGSQRIDPHITKFFGIRHRADAKGIQYNQKDTFHGSSPLGLCVIALLTFPPWQPPHPAPPSSWW